MLPDVCVLIFIRTATGGPCVASSQPIEGARLSGRGPFFETGQGPGTKTMQDGSGLTERKDSMTMKRDLDVLSCLVLIHPTLNYLMDNSYIVYSIVLESMTNDRLSLQLSCLLAHVSQNVHPVMLTTVP